MEVNWPGGKASGCGTANQGPVKVVTPGELRILGPCPSQVPAAAATPAVSRGRGEPATGTHSVAFPAGPECARGPGQGTGRAVCSLQGPPQFLNEPERGGGRRWEAGIGGDAR